MKSAPESVNQATSQSSSSTESRRLGSLFSNLRTTLWGDFSDDEKNAVMIEQLRFGVLRTSFAGMGIFVLIALLLYAVWGHIHHYFLIGFLGLFFFEASWKIPLVHRYAQHYEAGTVDIKFWMPACWLAAMYTSVVYGPAFLVLFLPLPIFNLLLGILAVAGIIFICFNVAIELPQGHILCVMLVVPLFIGLLLSGEFLLILAALAVFVTWLVVATRNKQVHDRLADMIRLEKKNTQLVQNLATEKEEAEFLREVAEKSVVEKSRFMAMASHDLRQPLHALGLFQVTLKKRNDNPKLVSIIDSIEKSTQALSQHFNGLLDISKLDAGVVDPEFEHVHLSSIFSVLAPEFMQLAEEKSLQFTMQDHDLVIHSDPQLVERVIRNLLTNAIVHTETGFVELRAQSDSEGKVVVTVNDSGCGIPERDIERIFNEFYQVERMTTEYDNLTDIASTENNVFGQVAQAHSESQGMGLGLAIVRRICALLEIEVTVDSTLGSGTQFSLRIPAGLPSLTEPNDLNSGADHLLMGKKVLVIDDDEKIRESMDSALTEWGCVARVCSGYSDAFKLIDGEIFSPDIVLCDYHLKFSANGVATSQSLRSILGDSIPIIIITGDSEPRRIQDIVENNFSLLQKPVSPDELKLKMLTVLSGSPDEALVLVD